MLRTAALTIFLAATTTVADEVLDPCFDYSDLTIDISPNACRAKTVFSAIRDAFEEKKVGKNCKGGAKREIRALMGTITHEAATQQVADLCESALADAAGSIPDSVKWDVGVDNGELRDFFEGDTFLNKETGNFQQTTTQFEKKGSEGFLSISDDPRKNDHYATTQESYDAGEAVKNFFADKSKTTYFEAPDGFGSCNSNTAMCCWHRDRQYFDQNGSCNARDCANENPGDNTDLCWTEDGGNVFPYPGDKIEKDLHCHGLSWSDTPDNADINSLAKWNSLFYVSMYDHMYKRGYVESITNDENIAGVQPMCGCIEEMNPVARADCNQVSGSVEYEARVVDNKIEIVPKKETFELVFEACEGLRYVDGLTPEDYDVEKKTTNFKTSNNDLAGFVFKQWLEGKIDDSHVEEVEEKLVGYRDPSVNNSDKNREEACKAAFEKKFPGQNYAEVETSEIDA